MDIYIYMPTSKISERDMIALPGKVTTFFALVSFCRCGLAQVVNRVLADEGTIEEAELARDMGEQNEANKERRTKESKEAGRAKELTRQ